MNCSSSPEDCSLEPATFRPQNDYQAAESGHLVLSIHSHVVLARTGDREAFVASVREQIRAAVQGIDASAAEAYEQAAPADQLWAGLERYWRKREEAAA